MLKFLSVILGSLATFLAAALLFILNVFLYPVFGLWVLGIDLIFLVSGLAFISCLGNISIPFVGGLLKRAYYRAKFKKGKKTKGGIYLSLLAGLIKLFKSAEEGFELIGGEAHLFYGRVFALQKQAKKLKGKTKAENLFHIHKQSRNRASAFSALVICLLVLGGLVSGFLSYFVFPQVLSTYAADADIFYWWQTDWSGGASPDIAMHDMDEGEPELYWNKFSTSTTGNISITADGITMASGTQELVDTERGDWNEGTFEDRSLSDRDNWSTRRGSESLLMAHLSDAGGACGLSSSTRVWTGRSSADARYSCNNIVCDSLDNEDWDFYATCDFDLLECLGTTDLDGDGVPIAQELGFPHQTMRYANRSGVVFWPSFQDVGIGWGSWYYEICIAYRK